MDDNKLPKEIYAWNYRGSFNAGLGLPVADMGDTPWAVYTRAQLKYKRVDLEEFILTGSNDYCDGNNKVIELIKSKYGDLYILTIEGK